MMRHARQSAKGWAGGQLPGFPFFSDRDAARR